jgi:tetratricopeptide (TPR) repeat protein
MAPPTFTWNDPSGRCDTWLVFLESEVMSADRRLCWFHSTDGTAATDWEAFKAASVDKVSRAVVLGIQRNSPGDILACGEVGFSISRDPVEAPLFYREVNLPFLEAVKDPSHIRWRFGAISSRETPRVVLEGLPVCGNCHSFSRDGSVLGMDVDYANNKGSYVITSVAEQMALKPGEIITWDSFRPEDNERTYGLLSQVSPDGRYVISTVKDKSVFVARPDLAYSQLFFPIKGILVVYDRLNRTFRELRGAEDPAFVQSNPTWSPDGNTILFTRAPAHKLKSGNAEERLLLTEEECAEFTSEGRPYLFDVYRLPFNQGEGGTAEPLEGASLNGWSNYFPRYSPDGKWIVFCRARSYMLLQPDSELFIIPAEGGEARRLSCNTSRMNSWHSWSPNSRWLAFSSKPNSAYTQLLLTHIDEQGESTPPVLLDTFTSPDRAANIPEFVNVKPGAIAKIHQKYLNDYSHARAGYVLENSGDIDRAITEYERALKLNSANVNAHQRLGFLLCQHKKRVEEGLAHTAEALRLDPQNPYAHFDLAMAMRRRQDLDQAISHFSEAARLTKVRFDSRYNPGNAHAMLGEALIAKGEPVKATDILRKAVALDPKNAPAHYYLAFALAATGDVESAMEHYKAAVSELPGVDTSPVALHHVRELRPLGTLPGSPGLGAPCSRARHTRCRSWNHGSCRGRLTEAEQKHYDAEGETRLWLSKAASQRERSSRVILLDVGRMSEARSAISTDVTFGRPETWSRILGP